MGHTAAQSGSYKEGLSAFLKRFGLLLVYLILIMGLSLLSDRFLTVSNQINIFRQATINGIVAVGMTLVILTAGIDLSVGSVLALSAVIGSDLLKQDLPVSAAVLATLGVGALAGLVNGVIITRGKIPPFIATLGMLTVARGLTLMYTGGGRRRHGLRGGVHGSTELGSAATTRRDRAGVRAEGCAKVTC